MKKILTFILAISMVLTVIFSGCVAEKTAEEHISAMFDSVTKLATSNDLTKFEKAFEDGGRMSVSVGDLGYLLNMFGVDTTALPKISDASFDVYGSSDRVIESVKAKLDDTLCDITFGMDAETLDIVLSSAQVADVYGINYGDLMALASGEAGIAINPDFDKLLTYDDAAMIALGNKYIDLIETLLIENTTLTKAEAEDKKQEIVTVSVTPEGLNTIVTSLCNEYKNDAEIKDLFIAVYGEEFTNEFYASFEDSFDFDILTPLTEAKFSATADLTVDKKTSEMSVLDIDITANGETVNALYTATENGGEFKLTIPDGGLITATVQKTAEKCSFVANANVEGEEVGMSFNAADGKFTVEVDAKDTVIAMNGSYEIADTFFKCTVDSVGMGGFSIDLTPAAIAITADAEAEVPELATATKSALDVTEQELQGILIEFIMNAGLFAYMN